VEAVKRAFLDTHAAVFLYEGRTDVWGPASRALVESVPLLVSPAVRLELQFLREIEKLTVEPDAILASLYTDCNVTRSADALEDVVRASLPLSWTRDPFDRMIVATSILHDAALLTRDRRILEHAPNAVW
jgi:PIN domain nuclease of toxin-antitoxin system